MGKFGLRFDSVETPSELAQLANFLRANYGSYDPERHAKWVDEVNMPALEAGNTRRAFAWWEQGLMVGDAVLKIVDSGAVELKNFRVAPSKSLRGVGLARTMLALAEQQAVSLLADAGAILPQSEVIRLSLDTTSGTSAEKFFLHHGFTIENRTELYTPGVTEAVMVKQITLE